VDREATLDSPKAKRLARTFSFVRESFCAMSNCVICDKSAAGADGIDVKVRFSLFQTR
jgi:hypothetical protein